MLLVGLDVGTTGVKAVVFREDGQKELSAYREYARHLEKGRRELQADDIWRASMQVLHSVLANAPANDGHAALSISSFGEAFVCVDADGNALTSPMLLTDDRGGETFFKRISDFGDERIAAVCGLRPHVSYSASKILWLAQNEPRKFAKTAHLLLIEDFIFYRLSGETVTDHSLASRTMLFDVHKRAWAPELLALMGVDERILSKPRPSGTTLGTVSDALTKDLGFSGAIHLVVGGHDQTCAAVTALAHPGFCVCSMGTSQCLTPTLHSPIPPKKILSDSFPMEPSAVPGQYVTLAYNVTSGLLIDWFMKTFAPQLGDERYAVLESELPEAPTRLFALPYLHGSGTPYLDPLARLALVGMDETAMRGDLYKAVLEGLSLDEKLNLSLLTDYAAPTGIIAVGGGSRSAAWRQIKADVLGLPVATLECGEAGALGCAMLCAVAMGLYPDLPAAARAMVRERDRIEPRPENTAFYQEKFAVYRSLHESCMRANAFQSGA